MLAFARQQISLRHKINTTIFTTRDCVWPIKTLDPDYHAPKQFPKLVEGSDDFACACVCVEFVFTWVIPIVCLCACVWVANENQGKNKQEFGKRQA